MDNIVRKHKQKKAVPNLDKTPIQGLIGGVAIAYAITCIVLIVYALLLTYTSVSEKNMSLVVILATIISVAIAGFDTARCAKEKGWFWGLIAGFIYAVILIIISAIVSKTSIASVGTLTILIISLASGAIGGMLGINSKK